MEISSDLDVKSTYVKAGIWVLGSHLLAIGLLVVGAFLKPQTELVMMAEMIDRQSSALVQNFRKSTANEVKNHKEALKVSDSAAETASEKKPVDGNPGVAAVYMPNADASELNNPKPPYPPISRRLGEQGRVILKACVSSTGGIDSLNLIKSSGFDRLDRIALETVQRWKFIPARRGQQPVAMCYQLPIQFTLEK
ncbi:MAG: energy transducer TonB [Polynucleobacter sp.]|nr:MAG: energy transducer TonB [Polynucleobacter sp.]